MKPLMPPIDTPDQVFHDGDPSTGELGTICSAEWLNNVQANIRNIQAECIAILKATGFTPDDTKDGQLWEAIQAAIKSQVPAASLTTAGVTQLSSSVTSDSETIAATLKAVKIAMDNANARMAKDRNGADIPNKALFRQNLELGNSATLNTGTTAGTVAAGDDARILASQKAIDDTQTGLAIQGVMWISTADDLSNLPAGARRFATNNAGVTVLPAAGYFFLEVLAKRDTANGSCILATSDTRDVWIGFRYTVPDEANFTWIQLNQNVENLGLKETVNQAAGAIQKSQNGDDIPDKDLFSRNISAALAFSGGVTIGGDANPWTTAEFIAWLESQGAFNHPYWMCRGSWSYADNRIITDTSCGNICLAGAVIEVMGVRGALTIRVTTSTTTSGDGVASAQFTYINNGDGYAPGWRRDYNTSNPQRDIAGNAATANAANTANVANTATTTTKLKTPRTIAGVAFDGTTNIDLGFLGYGQLLNDVMASRVKNVSYTNYTSKPVVVYVRFNNENNVSRKIYVNNYLLIEINQNFGYDQPGSCTFIVPAGGVYRVETTGVIVGWVEMR